MNATNTVYKLSESEAKRLEKILVASGKSRILELYYAIQENPQATDTELAIKIYGKANVNALRQLRYRLKNSITQITAAIKVIEVDRSASFNARHKINKYIVNSEALFATGREKNGVKLLKKALKESEKYNLWIQVASCADMLLRLYAPIQGVEEYKVLSDKRRLAMRLSEIEFEAQETYYLTMLPIFFERNSIDNSIGDIVDSISKLDSLEKSSDLNLVRYYNLRIKVFYYNYIKNFEKARYFADQFLGLIENDIVLSTKSNLSGALMQLSNIELYLSNYHNSIGLARRASLYFSNNAKNFLKAKEVEFVSLFCNEEYEQCVRLYEDEVESRIVDTVVENKTMWFLRLLGCYEMQGSSDRSVKMFSTHMESLRSIPSLDIGARLLELLSFISLQEWDLVEYRYRGFARLCSTRRNSISPRFDLISKHLGFVIKERSLESVSSDRTCVEFVERLSNGLVDLFWDPFSVEVIPYHKWYQKRSSSRTSD